MSSAVTPSGLESGTESGGSESSSSTSDSDATKSAEPCGVRSESGQGSIPCWLPRRPFSSSVLQPLTRDQQRARLNVLSGETKVCKRCEQQLPLEVFVELKGTRCKGGKLCRHPKCNQCRNKTLLDAPAAKAKAEYLEQVKAGPCTDCGNRFPSECMDFDHLDSTKKHFCVGVSWRWVSLEDIRSEVAKCELVCSNCHRTRTKKRGYTGGRKRVFLADVQRDATDIPTTVSPPDV